MQKKGERIAIIGAGSWGTALQWYLQIMVMMYVYGVINRRQVKEINTHHTNKKYLPNITLPKFN